MKASLDQRVDCQVKCDRSIQFRATKREPEVKTTTTTTKSIWQCAKICSRRWSRTESKKPSLFLKAEPLTEHLQRNPTYEKGQGRPLPAQGTPLTNLTTINLSRRRIRKLQDERVWKVCFARFIQSSMYPPRPKPIRKAPDLYHFKRLGMLCWLESE